MKTSRNKSIISLAVLSALTLSACNINLTTDEETQNTINKTSTGVIDALSQLNVNGVTYDTNNATIVTDGSEASETDLKLGMVVSVTGTENDDGTGKAFVIEYEDITEGIVIENNNAIDNTLNIMGQTVHIDDKTIFDSNDINITQLDEITAGNIVEVSGYTSGDGNIWATRIEVKKSVFEPGDVIEIKGKISNLTESTFNIGDLKINYLNSTFENTDTNSLKNGLYVEVSSNQSFTYLDDLIANSIEIKGDGDIDIKHANNDEEVELKGRITEVLNNTQIKVNGTLVNLSSDTYLKNGVSNNLTNGTIIEVEGYVDAQGNFHALRLEFDFETETEVESNDDSEESDNDLADSDENTNELESDDDDDDENHQDS